MEVLKLFCSGLQHGRWSICWVLRWLSRRPCAWAECVFVCPELSVKDRLSRTRCVRLILGVYDWSPRCSSREDIMCVFFYEKVRWDRFGRFWGLDLKRIVFWNDKFVETFTHSLTSHNVFLHSEWPKNSKQQQKSYEATPFLKCENTFKLKTHNCLSIQYLFSIPVDCSARHFWMGDFVKWCHFSFIYRIYNI